jgi:hypothetical protein
MERRAKESSSLIQTRLIGSEQYFETSGRYCDAANYPLAVKEKQGGFLVDKETRDASKG